MKNDVGIDWAGNDTIVAYSDSESGDNAGEPIGEVPSDNHRGRPWILVYGFRQFREGNPQPLKRRLRP